MKPHIFTDGNGRDFKFDGTDEFSDLLHYRTTLSEAVINKLVKTFRIGTNNLSADGISWRENTEATE